MKQNMRGNQIREPQGNFRKNRPEFNPDEIGQDQVKHPLEFSFPKTGPNLIQLNTFTWDSNPGNKLPLNQLFSRGLFVFLDKLRLVKIKS